MTKVDSYIGQEAAGQSLSIDLRAVGESFESLTLEVTLCSTSTKRLTSYNLNILEHLKIKVDAAFSLPFCFALVIAH